MTVATTASVTLRFFDLVVQLSSNDPDALIPFRRLYASFECAVGDGDDARLLVIDYAAPGQDGIAALTIDGECWPIASNMQKTGALYEFILKYIYAEVQSHLLIHASVVALGDYGVLLVGDSGHGKSTLAMTLAARGAGLLSDEVGALDRLSGEVHWFPRMLRVSRASLSLAGLGEIDRDPEEWFGKTLVDLAKIPGSHPVRAVPLRAIVFLEDAEPEGRTSIPENDHLEFIFNRGADTLARFVKEAISGQEFEISEADGLFTLRLEGERIGKVALEIEKFCRRERICLLDSGSPAERPTRFDRAPVLAPLAARHAWGRLGQQFLPGRSSRILRDEFNGASGPLLLEIMRLCRGVSFYRLSVGRLAEAVHLIEGLPEPRDPQPSVTG
jgi:energy-coupling factor transporter ATP-binding protein EcfA2